MLAALLTAAMAFPTNAACADVDADTIAVGRAMPAGGIVETSTARGPWERALGPMDPSISVCPVIAAAGDGTVILATKGDLATETSQVTIRRPGGAFGPPMTIRHREGVLRLAAVAGGQTAMLWSDWRGPYGEIFAQVNGTRTRLARSFGPTDLVLAPDGTATVVWNETEPASKHFAEFRGGRWSAPVTLYAGRHKGWSDSGVALAQAPSGRRLLAWMGTRALRVDVEGEPTTTVARPRVRTSSVEDTSTAPSRIVTEPLSVESISSALAGDGSAVVVYQTPDGLFAVDRGPDGPWSAPHLLARHTDHLDAHVEIASSGRALVTWSRKGGRQLAVTGQAGGRWGAPAPYEPVYTGTAHSDALTAWISSRMSRMPTVTPHPG